MTTTPARRAFSLVECTLATLFVAALLVATFNAVGGIARSRAQTNEQAVGTALAQRLMDEILQLPYNDPQSATCPLGPASNEVTGNRSLFDNVGDYANWSESTPANKSGTPIGASLALGRIVSVSYIDPTTLAASSTDKGAVKIVVSATRGGRIVASVTAIRTAAIDSALFFPPGSSTTGVTTTTSTVTSLAGGDP